MPAHQTRLIKKDWVSALTDKLLVLRADLFLQVVHRLKSEKDLSLLLSSSLHLITRRQI